MNASSLLLEEVASLDNVDYASLESVRRGHLPLTAPLLQLDGFEVTDVLPPPNHEDLHVRIMVVPGL